MILTIEILVLCAFLWLICFLGTGNDQKNLKSFASYPLELQDKLRKDEEYKDQIKESSKLIVFVNNLFLFTMILFIFGFFVRTKDFMHNFLFLLILGESANLFDLLVIDLLWWRNIKRIRFTKYQEKDLYQDPKAHIYAFLRGAVMFLLASLISASILILL